MNLSEKYCLRHGKSDERLFVLHVSENLSVSPVCVKCFKNLSTDEIYNYVKKLWNMKIKSKDPYVLENKFPEIDIKNSIRAEKRKLDKKKNKRLYE